jgi:hypothetical protein
MYKRFNALFGLEIQARKQFAHPQPTYAAKQIGLRVGLRLRRDVVTI